MKILLIDNDEISNFIVRKLINKVIPEAEVVQYNNPAEQWALILLEDPDIIFIDATEDNWEFLDSLPTEVPYKIYVLSASIMERDREKALSYPQVVDYIEKPLTLEKLTQILK